MINKISIKLLQAALTFRLIVAYSILEHDHYIIDVRVQVVACHINLIIDIIELFKDIVLDKIFKLIRLLAKFVGFLSHHILYWSACCVLRRTINLSTIHLSTYHAIANLWVIHFQCGVPYDIPGLPLALNALLLLLGVVNKLSLLIFAALLICLLNYLKIQILLTLQSHSDCADQVLLLY